MPSDTELLEHLYDCFNARDMDAALATMHRDVVWANGLEGGHVYGRDGVLDYWTRQWAMIDSHVEPTGFSIGADGTADVEVHLTARDLKGNLVFDKMGSHIFRIEDGLIRRFNIRWQPLINTPNYPDYTSGANNVTGAMTGTLALFFGRDKFTFEVTSLAPLAVQKTRTYHRFSEAAQDVVDARVYLGIHFRFADTAARTQGRRVAEWTFNHFLLPLDDDDHGHHGHHGDHADKR